MCLQGVICFESLMEEGRERGIVTNNKPIICKPNKVVSTHELPRFACTAAIVHDVTHDKGHAPLLGTQHSLHRAGAPSVHSHITADLP